MPSAPERMASLEERVANHIKFFWVVVGFGFVWLSAITVLLVQTKGSVARVGQAQAYAPAKTVAKLLSEPTTSTTELVANLNAASAILQTSKPIPTGPPRGRWQYAFSETPSVLKAVSSQLTNAQDKHPDLPQVWQTTSTFINYKSDSLLPDSSRVILLAKVGCTLGIGNITFTVRMQNCEVELDDLVETRLPDGSYPNYLLINCVVRYKGGTIHAKGIVFQNCVFRFQTPTVPSREGMLAMRQLTTVQDETKITLSLSTG